MPRKAVIAPQAKHISIDDDVMTVPDLPANLGPGIQADTPQPVHLMQWDGAVLRVERKSRVPGQIDVEWYHTEDALKRLEPFVEAYNRERDRIAAARAAADAQATAAAEQSARINAARAETDRANDEARQAQDDAERKARHRPPQTEEIPGGAVDPNAAKGAAS